jgi:hypothetical protein
MEKSSFYETGIPAFKGLIYDKSEDKFKVVATCPKAGSCILWCYARTGNYAMRGKPMVLMQRLNLMINDPEAYKDQAIQELITIALKDNTFEGTGNTLVIRWNDAGDFFDAYDSIYKKLAYEIIEEIKNTSIRGKKIQMFSYAYTKNIKHLIDQSDNIHWTFSGGSVPGEAKKSNPLEHKMSQVVPESVFKDLFLRKGPHLVKDSEGMPVWAEGADKEDLLQRVFDRFSIYGGNSEDNKFNIKLEGQHIPEETGSPSILVMQSDLPSQQGSQGEYAVVVLPTGDSDIGAMRKDVKTIFLCEH